MTDVKVEQVDREAAGALARFLGESEAHIGRIIAGELDHTDIVIAFARHRQAAEKAQQERDAGIADAHRQARVEAAKVAHARKAKSEARDHESMSIEALHIATAIRSQGNE